MNAAASKALRDSERCAWLFIRSGIDESGLKRIRAMVDVEAQCDERYRQHRGIEVVTARRSHSPRASNQVARPTTTPGAEGQVWPTKGLVDDLVAIPIAQVETENPGSRIGSLESEPSPSQKNHMPPGGSAFRTARELTSSGHSRARMPKVRAKNAGMAAARKSR